MQARDEFGRNAEERACDLLRAMGYRIVARNWRSRRGEIDVVARDGDVLVFIEVKARMGRGYGGPEGAVDRFKQRRIVEAAKAFLAATDSELPARFDVVAWEGNDVRVHRDAFRVDDVWPSD